MTISNIMNLRQKKDPIPTLNIEKRSLDKRDRFFCLFISVWK